MNDILKFGLIAVGGYFLYEYFVGSQTSTSTTTATSGTSTTPQAAQTTNANLVAQQAAIYSALVAALNAAQVDPTSLQTADVWGYYYAQVSGIAAPAPESLNLPGYVEGAKYALSTWWAAMNTNAGISGMGCLSGGCNGMGVIAHKVNPYYVAFQQGGRFGSNLAPTGMEMYAKRIGG